MDTPAQQTLNHKDSQATLISLLQLDPSPIETPSPPAAEAEADADNAFFPSGGRDISKDAAGTTAGTAAAPGLSSGRSSIFYLSRIQRYSSYATGVFAALHVLNVSLLPAITRSAASSETFLLMTRELYQTPLTEPLLVALPVFAHVGSGIALRLLRRWQNMKRYGGSTPGMYALHQMRDAWAGRAVGASAARLWPSLSYISVSGYALSLFYGAHVFVNRVLPLAVEGDSSNVGLAYVAHGFARHPVTSSVVYLGLLGTASGHMVWGMAKWLGVAPSTKGWQGKQTAAAVDKKTRRTRRRRWLAVHGITAGVVALWAVGGLGVVARAGPAEGWVGALYDDLFSRVGL